MNMIQYNRKQGTKHEDYFQQRMSVYNNEAAIDLNNITL